MLTLNDGRSELWQWDTGRTLTVDADCSQVHFSNKVFGRSIDVDVVDGVVVIPDILLQADNDLNVWAFVGTAENGYTKISKTFKVNRRNKPADYVFTPTDQTTLAELVERLDRIEETQDPDAIKNVVDDYLKQNPVEVPVQSVNGRTGAVELTAEDVGAIAVETDPTVPEWAKQPTKPTYTAAEVGALPDTYTPPNQTAQQVGADPTGTAASAVSKHNTGETAHNDIRIELQELSDRINAALDSDDTTLDQMSEVVAYIKSNKSLIDAITTSKVSVADIVDNLTTNVSSKPLSAAQGVVIKTLIDALRNDKLDVAELTNAVNTALAQAKASGEFDGADGHDGQDGKPGKDGITPSIGDNGNWYLGPTDTGKPSRGAIGAPGKDGHSPAVTATKSGKTVTISVDGSAIATVEDGADGNPGAAGVNGITPTIGQNGNWYLGEEDTGKPSRGVDGKNYILTDSDKTEIAQLVIAQLGGQPIFGTVDSSGNITVSGNLADGTYTVAYTLADGTTINVGSFTIGGETPSYTNLYHSETASINKRVNSSGVLVDAAGFVTTDYIAVADLFGSSPITIHGATNAGSAEHTAYIKGATFYNTANCCIAFCNSSKGQVGRFASNSANVKTYAGESGDIDWAKMFNTDGNNLTNVAYIRFVVKYSDSALQAVPSDIIITVDEAIE